MWTRLFISMAILSTSLVRMPRFNNTPQAYSRTTKRQSIIKRGVLRERWVKARASPETWEFPNVSPGSPGVKRAFLAARGAFNTARVCGMLIKQSWHALRCPFSNAMPWTVVELYDSLQIGHAVALELRLAILSTHGGLELSDSWLILLCHAGRSICRNWFIGVRGIPGGICSLRCSIHERQCIIPYRFMVNIVEEIELNNHETLLHK